MSPGAHDIWKMLSTSRTIPTILNSLVISVVKHIDHESVYNVLYTSNIFFRWTRNLHVHNQSTDVCWTRDIHSEFSTWACVWVENSTDEKIFFVIVCARLHTATTCWLGHALWRNFSRKTMFRMFYTWKILLSKQQWFFDDDYTLSPNATLNVWL